MSIKEKKFLVIGSNSFSGSHFVRHLLENGISCDGISRSKELEPPFLAYKWKSFIDATFNFYQLDLNKQLDEVIGLVQEEKYTHIVNFAAQSMVGQSWETPEDWYQTNVVSLSKLVNCIKDLDSIEKYLSITTPEVYGSTNGWIKERFNFAPSTPYAISRAAQDLHLKAYHETFDFPVIFTRAANVYGPGQSLYRIIPRAMIEALTNGEMILDGGGRSIRSFIHIEDVCTATLKIAFEGTLGDSYHISGNHQISIKELVELISQVTNTSFEKFVKLGPDRPGKDYAYLLDSSKIRDELGWLDTIDLRTGLSQTLDWINDNIIFLRNYSKEYVHKK